MRQKFCHFQIWAKSIPNWPTALGTQPALGTQSHWISIKPVMKYNCTINIPQLQMFSWRFREFLGLEIIHWCIWFWIMLIKNSSSWLITKSLNFSSLFRSKNQFAYPHNLDAIFSFLTIMSVGLWSPYFGYLSSKTL